VALRETKEHLQPASFSCAQSPKEDPQRQKKMPSAQDSSSSQVRPGSIEMAQLSGISFEGFFLEIFLLPVSEDTFAFCREVGRG
jgi:hypothetical protein